MDERVKYPQPRNRGIEMGGYHPNCIPEECPVCTPPRLKGNVMDAELSRRLIDKVIDICNEYFSENLAAVPDDRRSLIAVDAALRLSREVIDERKKETN